VVVKLSAEKRFGPEPMTVITVYEAGVEDVPYERTMQGMQSK
jgi:hypothetical protein